MTKIICSAIALAIALPAMAAAQTAPASPAHADMDHKDMNHEDCCCKKMKAEGQKMDCCDKHAKDKTAADAHADHGAGQH